MAVYFHPAYLTYMQSNNSPGAEILAWPVLSWNFSLLNFSAPPSVCRRTLPGYCGALWLLHLLLWSLTWAGVSEIIRHLESYGWSRCCDGQIGACRDDRCGGVWWRGVSEGTSKRNSLAWSCVIVVLPAFLLAFVILFSTFRSLICVFRRNSVLEVGGKWITR